jgi:hypothetical protein
MNPELTGYAERVQLFRSSMLLLTIGLTPTQLSWKPTVHEWSIAECLDHLNTVAFLLFPRLDQAIKAGRDVEKLSEGPFKYGMFGRWFVRSLEPSAKRKLKTVKLYRPSPLSHPPTVVQRCDEMQEQFLELLRKSDGLDLVRIRVSSPANALLRFSLGVWFASTVAHQQRHLVQLKHVREHGGLPRTEP